MSNIFRGSLDVTDFANLNSRSKDTLIAIEQNSDTVTYLKVGDHPVGGKGVFSSSDSDDYDRLGAAVGTNTHLTQLEVTDLYGTVGLATTNESFYDGIRRNTTINDLNLSSIDQNKFDMASKVLKVFAEKNILTKLLINTMPLYNSAEQIIAESLRRCTNLREILYLHSRITDDQLLPMVEAIRGHHLIEELCLFNNNIGNAGCEAVASLRNVTKVNLNDNNIGIDGIIAIANSLPENKNLRDLIIYTGNPFDLRNVEDDFCRALCNASSINDIYSSNHTLEIIHVRDKGAKLRSLLEMNKSTTNKRHVAIKKILLHYPHDFHMEPLFDLSLEEDDSERDLRALPHVISWFDSTAAVAIAESAIEYEDDSSIDDYLYEEYVQYDIFMKKKLSANDLEGRKLSAIYQFVSAMPMLFIPASHDNGVDNKRKRSDS